jgi:DNA repair exonuclease SbcCD ATPase subunit
VKLKRLRISNLRGAAEELDLNFPDGSLFIYGENGTGKTTVVDAIEFLTAGDIPGYHRQGCPLSAAIHIDSDSASVTAWTIDPNREACRDLTKNEGTGSLREAKDGKEVTANDLPDVPLLRHSTIRSFMDKTAGEKRKALLDLLGLDSLSEFRDTLKSAANDAKDDRQTAEQNCNEERQALKSLLDGAALIEKAEELRQAAGNETPIASEGDLVNVELKSIPGEPNRHKLLADLGRAAEGYGDDPAEQWNAAVNDQAIRSSEALAALIEKGQVVLEEWKEDACPLCEIEQDRDRLGESLESRAKALAEVREQVANLKSTLTSKAQVTATMAQAFRSVIEVAPPGGWPDQAILETAASALEEYEKVLLSARTGMSAVPSSPDLGLDFEEVLPKLRISADEAQGSERVAAHNALLAIKDQHRRLGTREDRLKLTRTIENAAKKVLSTAESTIKEAIEQALDEFAERITDYFEALMSNPVYSDISLSYESKYAGQVEFSVLFDGRESMTPPQKIMSESQLNALGIALFLARAKSDSQEQWQTLVLDDVVNSFDFANRQGLMRLLKNEFSDWQVLVFSHDASLRDIAQYIVGEGAGWRFLEIVAWDPKSGIVLDEGDPLNQLEKSLNEGKVASTLGGLARRALEQALSQVVGKLGYRVEYRPRANHTAFDLLNSLRRELKDAGSDLAKLDILDEIKASNYFATLGVHYRPGDPGPTKEDLRQLISDVRMLKAGLTCDECDKPVWFRRPNARKCECGQLAA